MGLSLEVGILADLHERDREGAIVFEGFFQSLNRYLQSIGMDVHDEPRSCEIWSADMYGYSGLHYLRCLAAQLDSDMRSPNPGQGDCSKDPTLQAYFADVEGGPGSVLSRIFSSKRRPSRSFDHLIVHSDAEGFYLPADFQSVLIAPEKQIPGGMVGSAPRLLAELDRLAEFLGIPESLHSQSDELWEAADSQGEGDQLWQRFGIESFSCVVLREGCQKCLTTGAALVFS